MTRRFILSLLAASIIGIYSSRTIPFNENNPFLKLVYAKRPSIYYTIKYSYLLMLFTTPLILSYSISSLAFIHLFKKRKPSSRQIFLPAEEPPEQRERLYVNLGELHHPTSFEPVPNPLWSHIPEKGLVCNIACFGAIGSGKTSSFIRPIVGQLFRYKARDPEKRLGGLILEVKGDFCSQVHKELIDAGRGDDYLELSDVTEYRYNALRNPDLGEDALAFAITTLIANIYGKDKDKFWPMTATNMQKFTILLYRLVYDYVTLTDIYRAIINPELLNRIIEDGKKKYSIVDRVVLDPDVYADNCHKLQEINFSQNDSGKWVAVYTKAAQETLPRLRIPYNLVSTTSDPVYTDKHAQFESVCRWFSQDWTRIDVKLRTSIVEGVSAFLSLFDSNPAVMRVFCPPKETFDPEINKPDENGRFPYGIPFPALSDCVESGTVIGLNFPIALNEVVARTLGVLLKLDYQRAMLLRIPKMSSNPEKHFRPNVICIDEYHQFATVGESGTGDQNFFSLSRQPKAIGLVATQSVISLRNVLGSDDAYKTLMQTFRSKFFLNTADDITALYASSLCGKDDKVQESFSITESNQDARTSMLTGRTYGTKTAVSAGKSYSVRQLERFATKEFFSLKSAQSIALVFDGVNPLPPSFLYLKPWYLPREISWWDLYRRGAFNE